MKGTADLRALPQKGARRAREAHGERKKGDRARNDIRLERKERKRKSMQDVRRGENEPVRRGRGEEDTLQERENPQLPPKREGVPGERRGKIEKENQEREGERPKSLGGHNKEHMRDQDDVQENWREQGDPQNLRENPGSWRGEPEKLQKGSRGRKQREAGKQERKRKSRRKEGENGNREQPKEEINRRVDQK